MRGIAAFATVTLVASVALGDAWDSAMARAAASKEKAIDSDDPVAWQEVLDEFLEADAIRATKESKYEIGFAAAKVKADDLAFEAYEQALLLGLSGPAQEKAKEFVAANAPKMGHVIVRGPAGAQVHVAGRRRAVLPAPRPIVLFMGVAHLHVTSNGKVVERDVEVASQDTVVVDLTTAFAPEPAPKPITPAPTPTPAPVERSNTLGWALVGTGAFVSVAGGVLWFVSAKTVSSRKDSLADVCGTYRTDDPDLCATPKHPEQLDYAQEDSNMIHTFKPLRVVGAVALGAGLVTTAIGVWQLRSKSEPVATVTPSIAHDGASFTLRVRF